MDLIRGLRIDADSRIAFVGSGGKTAALFETARAYDQLIFLTTTTHLGVNQLGNADQVFQIDKAADLPSPKRPFQGRVILFVASSREENRVGGLPPRALGMLVKLAGEYDCPLLIEADGARQLPLKAPADHEPALPDFVNGVVVVAGLSGLGKPLTGEWVHRPERFAALSGLAPGSRIKSEHLIKVLTSTRGGLKNVPEDARVSLILNQIDAFPNWRGLKRYRDQLLASYHAVLFTMLHDQLLLEVHQRIAGLVLAAGGSSRLGKPKQFLTWKGEPFIKRVARIALEARLDPVHVITGEEHSRAQQVLHDLDAGIHFNPDWQEGQSSSVQVGVKLLSDEVGGVVFLLVDQPQIPPALVQSLLAAHARRLSDITSARTAGQRTNPVLFDRSLFAELLAVEGDVGGRVLFDHHQVEYVDWEDERVRLDVDTPGDYRALLDAYQL